MSFVNPVTVVIAEDPPIVSGVHQKIDVGQAVV
jgi:hypothetical protein